MKKIKITEPIFHTEINLYTKCTQEEFVKRINNEFKLDVDMENEVAGRVFHCSYNRHLMWIDNLKDVGIVSHEMLHVIQSMKDYFGIDCEETEAYLLTYFLNNALGISKKEKIGRLKK